ncbi:glycosyltransferase family 2 protein [Paeniroseomonas aquatica]|uniref:Glycosyltransferase family 2 protein n=1 Tax=Paeniroseomonas aquatica TaxID=373043 RepID=A0ABT8A5N4_9PROT|nr:glycosyltransferase family 2 protein [Paeniroseomonas aquatica]MDN3565067.1 glycosyltransferase family 2 protein [Paeniroseomonas aquatica]
MPPVASVVIPAHDAAAFLGEALAACLAQTLPEIEVIVVDDGSRDRTWDILTAAAAGDRRIRPLRRAAAGGPGAARNAGLDLAEGRWVALLDADDLFLPDRLQRLVGQAERLQADLVADNPERRDFASGRRLGSLLPAAATSAGPLSLLALVQGDMPDQPADSKLGYLKPVFRRSFLEQHRLRYAEDIRVGEDFLFLFECLARGGRCHLLPEPGYVYRVREGSLSQGNAGALQLSRANRRLPGLLPPGAEPALRALLRRRQRLIDFDCFAFEIAGGHPGAALRHLHWGGPAHALRQFRLAAGAARRRLAGRG